jgi:hypothetical protein
MKTRGFFVVPLAILTIVSAGADVGSAKVSPDQREVEAPSAFEANRGQFGNRTEFAIRGPGYFVSLDAPGASFRLDSPKMFGRVASRDLRIRMIGAEPSATATAQDELAGRINYLIGKDPSAWITNVPTYARVKYENVYEGIDLVYYARGRDLEYDFVIAPGANADTIEMRVAGAERVALDDRGNLILETRRGSFSFAKPVAYQEQGGARVPVTANFAMLGARRIGFSVGAYDRTEPLVIDPVVFYSTFLGGSLTEASVRVGTDGTGSAYVAGRTDSVDFPVTGGAYETDPRDLFIAKLNPAGDALVYATYLGGTAFDSLEDMAVDTSGAVYLIGRTNSDDFPTTVGAHDATCGNLSICGSNFQDVFVTKLDPSGSTLAYSTFVGGDEDDTGFGIDVDASGAAYLTGATYSPDFPVTAGAFDESLSGTVDAFVTKLDPSGASLEYSTYIGGALGSGDVGYGIAVEGDGTAHVVGKTYATDFPTTPGAFDETCGSGACSTQPDLFVTKLNATGTALDFSTFVGGIGEEPVNYPTLAIDAAGATYITGDTTSTDFPTTPGAFQTSGSGQTGFVTKLAAAGDALEYSTYLGGSAFDIPHDIDVDSSGAACVTGYTASSDFPTSADALDDTLDGNSDAFLARLTADGSALSYASYIGGERTESGTGVVYDNDGVIVVGETESIDFSVTPGAYDTSCGGCQTGMMAGESDAFVVHSDFSPAPPLCGPAPELDSSCRLADANGDGKSSLQIKNDAVAAKDSVRWKWTYGVATALGDFKMPDTGSATYRLCIYDGSLATQPLFEADIAAGGVVSICGTKPCWKAIGTSGFKYANKDGNSDDITAVRFKAGIGGKAQVQVRGKGALLSPPATDALVTDVVVQLLIDDGGTVECFKTAFPGSSGAGGVTQDDTQFKAKGP